MGRGVAHRLANKGANIVLVARDVEKLEAAINYLEVCLSGDHLIQFAYRGVGLGRTSKERKLPPAKLEEPTLPLHLCGRLETGRE